MNSSFIALAATMSLCVFLDVSCATAGDAKPFVEKSIGQLSPSVTQRDLTIDDAIRVSSVGALVTDQSRSRVIYEYEDKSSWSADSFVPTDAPLSYYFKLYTASIRADNSAQLLFEQYPEAGYVLASASALSTGGRHLAFFELRDSAARIGIYTMESESVQLYDFPAFFRAAFPTFVWISDHEFIAIEKAVPQHVNVFEIRPDVQNARYQTHMREAALKNRAVTADAIGAGRYIGLSERNDIHRLIQVNIQTGETTRLARGTFNNGMTLSLNGRYLTLHSEDRPIAPDPEELLSTGATAKSKRLLILDLENRHTFVTLPNLNVATELMSWSDEEDHLLFFASPIGAPKSSGTFHVYDTGQGNVVDLGVSGRPSQGRYFDRGKNFDPEYIPHAYWLGNRIAFPSREGSNWRVIDQDRKTSTMTTDLPSLPHRPIAQSREALFFLVDGAVWRISEKGQTSHVSSEDLPALRPTSLFRTRRVQSDRLNWLHGLSETPLTFQKKGVQTIIYLSESGDVVSKSRVPDARVSLKSITPAGAAYVQNSAGVGSKLIYAPARERGSVSNEARSLHTYNTHLADVCSTQHTVKVHHHGGDGEKLTSWLFLPPDADIESPGKYPTIVVIYAGTVFSATPPKEDIWRVNDYAPISTQLLTAKGYAVLLPSIPMKASPSDPMLDLVPPVDAAIDAAIATGYVDAERLAVSGHSFGGYSALALAVQSDRFKAIIASASVSNPSSRYGQFAVGWRHSFFEASRSIMGSHELGQFVLGGNPWTETERYVRNSPVFQAENVQAPVMLIHGGLDSISLSQPEEIFTALSRQNKDVLFVRYWGERHGIQAPRNVKDMWARVFDFLEDSGVTPESKTVH